MTSEFTKRQVSVLLFILRLSWGCGKKYAVIPHKRDFEIAGVGESKIKAELELLERDKVIAIDGDRYSFNKDYDQWRVSRARGYTAEKLAGMVKINLEYYQHEDEEPKPAEEVRQESEERQLELLAKLKADFPGLNLLGESKKWAARKIGDPLKKGSVPSQQLYNWMVKAKEFNGQPQRRVYTETVVSGPARGVEVEE
jgi:hypothetical protein